MIKIGMMVADRYEVLEKVGAGGMSDVFRAKDHKLNRFVAVKVLKQEFSENTEFRSKFRMEAQAAAGLMHANIVNVYDVGEESGSSYIVMELVEGITLKKYIEKKARLSVKEAVSIAIQVARGIEAAHNNHIIHRDIKPQNIIISKEGKVKVTDFGIAKAATSNTITSNVMGSVHYTSPEQVRGGFSDEKSDIYSLGITLFEMLTGRVPYNGETTVAVAIQHIQEPMPSPRDYVSEIPVSVEQIVLKCTEKSPDMRYQYAGELIEDLKRSLISPDEDFVRRNIKDTGGVTRNFTEEEISRIRGLGRESDGAYGGEEAVRENPRQDTEPIKKKTKQHTDAPKESSKNVTKNAPQKDVKKTAQPDRKKKSKKKRKADAGLEIFTTVLVVTAAVVVGIVFIYIVGSAVGIFGSGTGTVDEDLFAGFSEQVQVPEVKGVTEAKALELLSAAGFKASVEYQVSTTVNQGTVIDISLSEGSLAEKGAPVTVFVSSGSEGVMVPSVIGMSQAEATVLLENEGITVKVNRLNSNSVPRGTVINQYPKEDSRVARGTEVTLDVSLGAETADISMPDLKGKSEEEAIAILVEAGLDYDSPAATEYSDIYAAGQVCYQNYSPGITISTGTVIKYKLSKGPEPGIYNCIYNVQAPADYIPGSQANIVLYSMEDLSMPLWQLTANSFPQPIALTGLNSIAYGTLVITYPVSEIQTVQDEAGNITQQTVTSMKTSDPVKVPFEKVQ
ncbi:MAG: Stk1 family PASTA domain-containing Ser/Thr kinase [Lachnospiraceae bacterium]|nr:Stk1 family PASTA domain-containing Ser/Thr kinase [Lachnospiraceae bacterium]